MTSNIQGTGTILDKILAHKHQEVIQRKARVSQQQLQRQLESASASRGFRAALADKIADGLSAVIAEVKKASPSKGIIREDFDPVSIAKQYSAAGAACLSVLTDERFFQGHDDYLVAARRATDVPVLRKDFVIDSYQIYEARALGADAVLLIVAALVPRQLRELYDSARALDLDILVEVHDEIELDQALALGADLIGINNRNLKTFETTLDTTLRLRENVPAHVLVVTESGIRNAEQVRKMHEANVHAFLVGESLMRQPDPGIALKALFPTALKS